MKLWIKEIIKALKGVPEQVRTQKWLNESCDLCCGGYEPPEWFGLKGPCPKCGGTGKRRRDQEEKWSTMSRPDIGNNDFFR